MAEDGYVIPDTRGTVLHEIEYNHGGDGDPEEGVTFVDTHYVVGWRIVAGHGAHPIIPGKEIEEPSRTRADYMVIIQDPNGFVELGGFGRYDSLEAARKALVERCGAGRWRRDPDGLHPDGRPV